MMAPCLSRAESEISKRLQSASSEAGDPGNLACAMASVSLKRLVGRGSRPEHLGWDLALRIQIAMKLPTCWQKVDNFQRANFRNAVIPIGVKTRGLRIKNNFANAVHDMTISMPRSL